MHWQRDRTTPPNWPWSTRNTCNVATHQYISLNNSGILSFPVPAILVHCAFNWSLILLFVHQLLLGKKPNSIEKHYPRTCILQGALPHTALSSPCSFHNVISFSYNLFSKKIWPLQKGFCERFCHYGTNNLFPCEKCSWSTKPCTATGSGSRRAEVGTALHFSADLWGPSTCIPCAPKWGGSLPNPGSSTGSKSCLSQGSTAWPKVTCWGKETCLVPWVVF